MSSSRCSTFGDHSCRQHVNDTYFIVLQVAEAITTTTITITTTLEVGEGNSSLLMPSAGRSAFCTVVQDTLLNPLVSQCAF
jgi:hypothetical protein